jgi:aspartokinase/homoserine dehydrogenase 1
MQIYKFGGSSVGTPDRITRVLDIVASANIQSEGIAVVFSAYQGVTNQLIAMGEQAAHGNGKYQQMLKDLEDRHLSAVQNLIGIKERSSVLTQIKLRLNELEEILHGVYLVKELTPKMLDYIMSFGERMSAYTIAMALRDRGIEAEFVDTRDIFLSDSNFGRARIDFKTTNRRIRKTFSDARKVYIVTGFIAATAERETTTIGRGGSDYTASVLGAALQVREIVIWTDVDGVLTADPNKVPDAFPIAQLTYEEAMELSHFGAKVIYPPTMQPALDRHIPIRVRNSFNPDFEGTVISHERNTGREMIRGISSIDEVALLMIQGSGMIGIAGIAHRLFEAMAREKINVIMISQASSEHSICLAIPPANTGRAEKAVRDEFRHELSERSVSNVSIEPGKAIIAVVGENMRRRRGIAGRVFQALGEYGVNISAIAQGSSELNISMVIDRPDEVRALNSLHHSFFTGERKQLSIFLAGTGLIGGTLLKQIDAYNRSQQRDRAMLHIAGLTDIRKMILEPDGIDPASWQEARRIKGSKANLNKFVSAIKTSGLVHPVFVDCTASEEAAALYPDLLENGIAVVAANKKACSADSAFYQKLLPFAGKKYFYETNVCAGLPVIGAIRDLVATGDRIVSIKGVLSGTLSYLFNNFDGSRPFSALVKDAQQRGFTEPDPREDLNGMDVARKILILIREAGFRLEPDQIKVGDLVPAEAREAETVGEFYIKLRKYDKDFAGRLKRAQSANRVLRYLARFENGKAVTGLEEVDQASPFYSLTGSDNIVAVYSRYYHTQPLVIRGPGAGADVTASGVLADILRLSRAW